jgi:hypothetical protein
MPCVGAPATSPVRERAPRDAGASARDRELAPARDAGASARDAGASARDRELAPARDGAVPARDAERALTRERALAGDGR